MAGGGVDDDETAGRCWGWGVGLRRAQGVPPSISYNLSFSLEFLQKHLPSTLILGCGTDELQFENDILQNLYGCCPPNEGDKLHLICMLSIFHRKNYDRSLNTTKIFYFIDP